MAASLMSPTTNEIDYILKAKEQELLASDSKWLDIVNSVSENQNKYIAYQEAMKKMGVTSNTDPRYQSLAEWSNQSKATPTISKSKPPLPQVKAPRKPTVDSNVVKASTFDPNASGSLHSLNSVSPTGSFGVSRITKFSPSSNEIESVPENKVTTPLIDGKVAAKKDLEMESSLSKYTQFSTEDLTAIVNQINQGNPGIDRSEKDQIFQALIYKKALDYESKMSESITKASPEILNKIYTTMNSGLSGMLPEDVQKYRNKIESARSNIKKEELDFDSTWVIPLLGLTEEERLSFLAQDDNLPYLRLIESRLGKISDRPSLIGLDTDDIPTNTILSKVLYNVKQVRAGSQGKLDDILVRNFSENIPIVGESLAKALVGDNLTEAKVGDMWDVLAADVGELAADSLMYVASSYALKLGVKGAGKLFNMLKGKVYKTPSIKGSTTATSIGSDPVINKHKAIISRNLATESAKAQRAAQYYSNSKPQNVDLNFRDIVDFNEVGRYTQQLKAIERIESTPALRKQFLGLATERDRYNMIDQIVTVSRPKAPTLPSATQSTPVKTITLPTGETLSNLSEARSYLTDFVLTGDKARKVAAKLSTEQLDTLATKLLNGEVPSGMSELRNFILNKANRESLFSGATSNATKFMESYPGLNGSQYAFLADIESKLNSMAG